MRVSHSPVTTPQHSAVEKGQSRTVGASPRINQVVHGLGSCNFEREVQIDEHNTTVACASPCRHGLILPRGSFIA